MYKYFLGFRYLFSRPINLLGVGGVAVGVWFLITVVAIFSGFIREVRTHIRGTMSDVILHGVTPDVPFPEVERAILENPEVRACAPRIVLPALLVDNSLRMRNMLSTSKFANLSFTKALGVDPAREAKATDFRDFLTHPKVTLGERVDDLEAPFRVAPLESQGFGKQQPGILLSSMNGGIYRKGQSLGLITANLYPDEQEDYSAEQYLIKRDLDVAGFYESRYQEHNQFTVYIHIDTARAMLGYDPLDAGYREVFNEVSIRLKDGTKAAAVRDDLKVRLIPVLGDPRLGRPWEVQTWEQQRNTLLKAVDNERAMMKLLLMISLVVAGFLILATLSMMVTEKTRDVGILTALGATRAGVLYVFLFCGFVISFVGAALGSLAGWLSCLYLNDFNDFLDRTFGTSLFPREIYNLDRIPTELDPVWMAQVFVGAILLALLFAFFPALRAARFEPVRALRYE